jgi:hypothetical protein
VGAGVLVGATVGVSFGAQAASKEPVTKTPDNLSISRRVNFSLILSPPKSLDSIDMFSPLFAAEH